MTNINLIAGDYDFSEMGTHIINEKGFAIKVAESKSIMIEDATTATNVVQLVEYDRVARGLNPDGSISVPPEVVPEVVSPEVVSPEVEAPPVVEIL